MRESGGTYWVLLRRSSRLGRRDARGRVLSVDLGGRLYPIIYENYMRLDRSLMLLTEWRRVGRGSQPTAVFTTARNSRCWWDRLVFSRDYLNAASRLIPSCARLPLSD